MTKHKSLNAIVTTEGGNNYYVSRGMSQLLLIHPVLKYMVELKEKGKLKKWMIDLQADEAGESGEVKIDDGLYCSKKEALYYYRYLKFLEEQGYFEGAEKYEMTADRFKAEDVKRTMANTLQIVFEVTEACNLNCKYCGYGELYSGFDKRENRNLDFDIAKIVLDYMVDLFESPLNRNHHKKIALSFYGGEPLLNMHFIKNMVDYAKRLKLTHKRFYFTMTTNGILLDKYMDFLADNNFKLLISLDGDENSNGHRCFPDGSSSFEVVYSNIIKMRLKYPDYFKNSINFISVIHDKNSNNEVRDFFKREFQKIPILTQVNSDGIKTGKKAEFERIFKPMYSGLDPQDIIADTKKKEKILITPFIKQLFSFLSQFGGFVFRKYDSLICKNRKPWNVSTGTCHPFAKKIFVTAKGKILPCERILHAYSLGTVDKKGVHVDFKEVAKTYNQYYGKLMNQCNKCSNSDACPFCIFKFNMNDENEICKNFMTNEQFKKNLFQQTSMLEETPRYYYEILRNYQVN
jgi:uncharacterized protein